MMQSIASHYGHLCTPTNIMGRFVLQGDCFSITRTPNDVQIKKETDRWAI